MRKVPLPTGVQMGENAGERAWIGLESAPAPLRAVVPAARPQPARFMLGGCPEWNNDSEDLEGWYFDASTGIEKTRFTEISVESQ